MGRSALRLLKFARKNPKSTQSTLSASAAVPSSGFTFIDNSQGASAAVAELSDALIDSFEDFNLEDPKTELESLIRSLDEKGSEFSNSKLKDEQCQPWFCSEEEARLIAIAWKCADEAYSETFVGIEEESPYYVESCTSIREHVITPSTGGTVKRVLFTTVFPKSPSDSLSPMLVIAIRGSASQVDFMVNADGNPHDVKEFIPTSRFHDLNLKPSLQAHAGFLRCASALDSIVSEKIEQYKETKGVTHVVFTGHSAGGAVASLLYLRNLSKGTDDSPRFSCITFGAPPTVSFPVNLDQSPSPNGLCLNIINEFDPVSRADKSYILSLVNLIRVIHGRAPFADKSTDFESSVSTTESESFQTHSMVSLLSESDNIWPVPTAVFCHVGPRIILRKRLRELEEGATTWIQAVEVSQAEFEKLMFWGVAVHKRQRYGERVKALARGQFNGADGWHCKLAT